MSENQEFHNVGAQTEVLRLEDRTSSKNWKDMTLLMHILQDQLHNSELIEVRK
jgi:hypothetical protein